jgi:CheY-like chemotaxis protein
MNEPICLIVDNEPALRTYLSVILKCKGIQSLETENAVEALRTLRKLNGEIDLLITDIQVPVDMDGIGLAYSVRNMFSSLPVILISGTAEKAPTVFHSSRSHSCRPPF